MTDTTKKGIPPIVYIGGILLVGGLLSLFLIKNGGKGSNETVEDSISSSQFSNSITASAIPTPAPEQQLIGVIKISGSASMAALYPELQTEIRKLHPGITLSFNSSPGGSTEGINDVLSGTSNMAGISRPLTQVEMSQGLYAKVVAYDAIAIAVGVENPVQDITIDQLKGIYSGYISNWSELGGPNLPIKVFIRPEGTGTEELFRTIVMEGTSYGTGPQFTRVTNDVSTPIFRQLGADGIYFAGSAHVDGQRTLRVLKLDGSSFDNPSYPLVRPLMLVTKTPIGKLEQAVLDLIRSDGN